MIPRRVTRCSSRVTERERDGVNYLCVGTQERFGRKCPAKRRVDREQGGKEEGSRERPES